MKKIVYLYLIILIMLFAYTIPAYGERYFVFDEPDPINDQYVLIPGLALNGVLHYSEALMAGEGSWNFNQYIGINAAFNFAIDDIHLALSVYGKKGPFYGELGWVDTSIHTGLNAFFPLIGRSGPGFENDLNICPFNSYLCDVVKGGWIWLFGEQSHLLIGGLLYGANNNAPGNFKVFPIAELVLDERFGPFIFDGKSQLIIVDYLNFDTNVSMSFMPFPWVGIGTDLGLKYDNYFNSWDPSTGINLVVRI